MFSLQYNNNLACDSLGFDLGGFSMLRIIIQWTLGFFLFSNDALARSKYNMPPGVTEMSHEIYHLHMLIFWVCVAIAVVVFGVMLYALIFHRKSRGVVPADFHEHLGLEIAWAIVPFIILVAMAIPATQVLIKMNDSAQSDVTIKITGFQWKWKYDYLQEKISFFSNLATPFEQIHNPLKPKNRWYLLEVDKQVVVPINKKIRFLMTANDVIHSWWVPDLGIKADAVPGFIHEAWARIEKPGIYRGQCAELCGINHAYMPIVVKAVEEKEYDKWVESQKPKPKPKADDTDSKKTDAENAAAQTGASKSMPQSSSADNAKQKPQSATPENNN